MEEKPSVQLKTLRGREILPYIHKIAALRITIFREYPYLYQGEVLGEERYLHMYAQTPDAVIVVVEDKDEVVGAIAGLPLTEFMQEVTDLFGEYKISCKKIFYLGEIILLQKYRGKIIGYLLYQQFENAVKDIGVYEKMTLCEVVRSENDLRRPLDYKPLSSFWKKLGFVKHPDLVSRFSWKEIGDTKETKHPMVFWIKRNL